jgi:hypothetical protein
MDAPGDVDQRELARELWRAEVAEQHLGLAPLEAGALASNPLVDVCTARELVAQGCPPGIAIDLATRERLY